MPRDVNPFEPWRPRHADRPAPAVDPLRPWRPRRLAETAAPIPPRPQAEGPRPVAPPPAPPALPPDPGRQNILAMILLLLAGGTVAVAALGSEHFARVFLAVAALGAGWGASITLARRRPWTERLACVGAGVLVALAVRWFVPTFDGGSLWGAGNLAAETEAIPTGDVETYWREARHRKAAMKHFPEYAGEIKAAERAWVHRTADEAIATAPSRIERDPVAASRELRKLVQFLDRLDYWPEVRDALQEVRRKAMRARIERVGKELEVMVARGAGDLVPAAANRALAELHDEAREIGLAGEVVAVLTPVRRKAFEARLEAVVGQLEAAVGRGEFSAVAREGEKALAALSDEAREVGLQERLSQRLFEARRKAVLAALEAARGEVMPLLARNRREAVARLGEQLARVLADEAQAVGAAADLERFRQACQDFGDLAGPERP